MDYTISVTQNKIRRLPKPYASRCTDYLQMGWKNTFYGYLDQNVSIYDYEILVLMKMDASQAQGMAGTCADEEASKDMGILRMKRVKMNFSRY